MGLLLPLLCLPPLSTPQSRDVASHERGYALADKNTNMLCLWRYKCNHGRFKGKSHYRTARHAESHGACGAVAACVLSLEQYPHVFNLSAMESNEPVQSKYREIKEVA